MITAALAIVLGPMADNGSLIAWRLCTTMKASDVTATLGGITLNQTGRAIECVVLLMLFYLVISLGISMVMNVCNNATKLKER